MPLVKKGVNFIPDPGADTGESYEQLLERSCSRCSIVMTFVKAIGNYKCLRCGWEPIKKEKAEKPEQESY